MTAVCFQLKSRRVELLSDTLCVRGNWPSAWTCKAAVLPATKMILSSRGPDRFRHELCRHLEHTFLPNGIESALPIIEGSLRETYSDLTGRFPAHVKEIDTHFYAVGWSPGSNEFVAYRWLSPDFVQEKLPHGLHCAPGPGEPTYYKAGWFATAKLLEVVKIQKRGVVETHGYECIGGDVMQFEMSTHGVSIKTIYRFPDADKMNAEMQKRAAA